jgi:hypothetical protein
MDKSAERRGAELVRLANLHNSNRLASWIK